MRSLEKVAPFLPYRSGWPREFSLEAMPGNVQRMGMVLFLAHQRTADFSDVGHHPTAEFVADAVEPIASCTAGTPTRNNCSRGSAPKKPRHARGA